MNLKSFSCFNWILLYILLLLCHYYIIIFLYYMFIGLQYAKIRKKYLSLTDKAEHPLEPFLNHNFAYRGGRKEAEKLASRREAEELSAQEPTYVGRGLEDNKPGKIFGSFNDEHGWYNQDDEDFEGEFDFDYEEVDEEHGTFYHMSDEYGDEDLNYGSMKRNYHDIDNIMPIIPDFEDEVDEDIDLDDDIFDDDIEMTDDIQIQHNTNTK